MAKAPKKTATAKTRAMLIETAEARVAEAQEVVSAAETTLAAIEDGQDRADAESKVAEAKAELERREKARDMLAVDAAAEAVIAKPKPAAATKPAVKISQDPSQGDQGGGAGANVAGSAVPERRSFPVLSEIHHDGVVYRAGDTIDLDRAAFAALPKGDVEGDWVD